MLPFLLPLVGGVAGALLNRAVQRDPAELTDVGRAASRLKSLTDPFNQQAASLRAFNPEQQQDYLRALEARQQQMQLSSLLGETSAGRGPFIADESLRQSREANLAQALAMQSSARPGMNVGLTQRGAMLSGALANQQAARDAALQRLQEVQQARALQGNLLQQVRSGDFTGMQSSIQARLGMEDAASRQQQLAQNLILGQVQGNQAAAGVRAEQDRAFGQNLAGVLSGGIGSVAGMLAPSTGAGGGAAQGVVAGMTSDKDEKKDVKKVEIEKVTRPTTPEESEEKRKQFSEAFKKSSGKSWFSSDENEKKNIQFTDEQVQDFLDKLQAFTYEYKDKKNGEGRQLGIMAQDLEKSEIGDRMVEDTDEGKVVNFGKGFGQVLAAMAHMNKRLKELEK